MVTYSYVNGEESPITVALYDDNLSGKVASWCIYEDA
mgnify:CR=1 FL=1